MPPSTPEPFDRAVQEFARLPGVGKRTAERLIFHLLGEPPIRSRQLAESLTELVSEVRECRRCHHLTSTDLCSFCSNPKRDGTLICVVEMPQDLIRIEEHCDFRGLYHVLGGRYAPLEGIFPEDLNLDTLLHRAQHDDVREVILAMNPNTEGEATSLLIQKRLGSIGRVKTSRLASGLPQGSEIGYAGKGALNEAFQYRRPVS